MDGDEREVLLQKYMEISEEELIELLTEDESNYQEGIYALMIRAAKSKGLGPNIDERIKNAVSAKKELAQKISGKSLSPLQRIMFILLPGLAFWYHIFTNPLNWERRTQEAAICQSIGAGTYLLFIMLFTVGVTMFSNAPTSSGAMMAILFCFMALCGNGVHLLFQIRKYRKNYNESPQ